jgi:hypothetical protein
MVVARTVRERLRFGPVLYGLVAFAACVFVGACGDDTPATLDTTDSTQPSDSDVTDANDVDASTGLGPLAGPHPRFELARTSFYDGPVPAPDLFGPDGHPDLSAFPREPDSFVDGLVALTETTDGASLAGSVYFALTDPLPDGVIERLVGAYHDLDTPAAPTVPAHLHFERDGGPHGAANLLSAQPIQGLALMPQRRYALTITLPDDLRNTLGRPALLADLLADRPTPTLTDRPLWDEAVALIAGRGPLANVFAMTVFRTQDTTSELADYVAAARAIGIATPTPTLLETHDRFCVYSADIAVPDYQHGDLPYTTSGEGVWRRLAGEPELAKSSPSRLFITIPRKTSGNRGYPFVVFIRTGGGGDRPLIDRGPRASNGGPPIEPAGTGPAMHLAEAGWAGLTWDGPHGGPGRNPSGADEQFLMFNVLNLAGTRDSIRQTALEAILIRDLAATLTFDTSDCDGASTASKFDATLPRHNAIMGHSMGGWIAPIALAHDAGFGTAILSGAGGGWMANIVYKKSPIDVRPLAEALLGYTAIDRTLGMHDPSLTLLQWAGESADPQAYGHLARPNRNILMIEGIVDTYILPPIAQGTSLALRLDLAGPPAPYDTDPRLADFVPLTDLLPLAGLVQADTPVRDNRNGHTAVVVQAPGDLIEDGHEAAFQTPGPKHQYRCFLESLARTGVPTVVTPSADEWASCP